MGRSEVSILLLGDSKSAQRAFRELNAIATQTDNGLTTLGNNFTAAGDKMIRAGRSLSIGVTLPLIAAATRAVQTARDFELSMNTMAAVAGVPGPELRKLRDLAIDLGRKTVFSANEAAQGMLELSKAGISTSNILRGGLKNALDLATAGELELGDAARITANGMQVFNLTGRQSQQVADALAGAANASSADVADLALALAQGGMAASRAGLSIQETTGILAAFADAGIRGSDAGTSLKTFLLNLVPTSIRAKETMNELNISFVDASGKIKPLSAIAQELRDKLEGLTQAEQQAALKVMFGTDAFRAASIVMEQGAEGVRRYTRATSEQGAASEVTAGKMKGLPGAIETLRGSIETVFLAIGNQLAPVVKDAAAFLTELANKFSSLSPEVQQTIIKIAAIAAALGPVLFILGNLTKGIGHAITAIGGLGDATGRMKAAFALGAVALVNFALSFERAESNAESFMERLDDPSSFTAARVEVQNLAAASADFGTRVSDAFKAVLTGAPTAQQRWAALREEVEETRDSLREMPAATAAIAGAKARYTETVLNAAEAQQHYNDIADNARRIIDSLYASESDKQFQTEQLTAAEENLEAALEDRNRAEGDLERALKLVEIATAELQIAEEGLLETRGRLAGLADRLAESELNERDAKRHLADAQKELNRLEERGITSGRQYKEARDAIERAEIGVRDAKRGVNEVTKDLLINMEAAANKGRASEAAFVKLADALGVTKKQAASFIDDLPQGSRRLSDVAEKLDLTERQSATLHKALEVLQGGFEGVPKKAQTELRKLPGIIAAQRAPSESAAHGVGSAMASGVAAGVRSGASAVMAAVVALANSAIATMKGKLDIRSPSRVFESMGRQVAQGFAAGISKEMGTALRVLDQTLNQIVRHGEKIATDVEKNIDRIRGKLDKALKDDKISEAQGRALKAQADSRIKALREYADAQERTHRELERQGEALGRQIDRLNSRIDGFKGSIAGGFDSLGDVTSFDPSNEEGQTLQAFLRNQLRQARQLGGSLRQLAGAGLNQGLIAQIAGQGAGGIPLAEALLAGGDDLIRFANETMREINQISQAVQETLVGEFFGDEIKAAQKELDEFARAVERATKVIAPEFDLDVPRGVPPPGQPPPGAPPPGTTGSQRPGVSSSSVADDRGRLAQIINHNRIDKVEIAAKDLREMRDVTEFFDRIQQVVRQGG